MDPRSGQQLHDAHDTPQPGGDAGPPTDAANGHPQGSPLSPIVFLFFVGGVVDAVHDPVMGVAATGFVDDVNMLVVGLSASANAVRL